MTPSAKRLQKDAYRAWFVGLVFNTVAGLYTLWLLRKAETEDVEERKKINRHVTGFSSSRL